MQKPDKFLQALGIPHSAFLSVIFGMMLLSFPMGMFVVFHSDIGEEINFELPLGALNGAGGLGLGPLSGVELGDAFVVLWSLYAALFAVAMLGPKAGFMKTVSAILSRTDTETGSNYMVATTKWFSIIILASAVINFVQEGFGIATVPPPVENNLVQFFYVSLSPLVEEIGFRVVLIGLPLFALYARGPSARHFFRSLWCPSSGLGIRGSKKALALIVLAGVLFGFAHVAVGESWSEGKFAQASAAGIMLGWVYFRFGFVAALLVHWATNYFIFAYANFLAQINDMTVGATFSHSLITTMEVLFLISGALSLAVIAGKYYGSRRRRQLEV